MFDLVICKCAVKMETGVVKWWPHRIILHNSSDFVVDGPDLIINIHVQTV